MHASLHKRTLGLVSTGIGSDPTGEEPLCPDTKPCQCAICHCQSKSP